MSVCGARFLTNMAPSLSQGGAIKPRRTRHCADCPAVIAARGGKERCGPCSDARAARIATAFKQKKRKAKR